jgi:hypothetical protein
MVEQILLRTQQVLLFQIMMCRVARKAAHVAFRMSRHDWAIVTLSTLLANEIGWRLLVTEDRVALVARTHVLFTRPVTAFAALSAVMRGTGNRLLLLCMTAPARLLADILLGFLGRATKESREDGQRCE